MSKPGAKAAVASSFTKASNGDDDIPEWKKNLRKRGSKPITGIGPASSGGSHRGSHEFQNLKLRKTG